MSEKMKVLEAFIAASKKMDHDAILDLMTDDIEYYWHMHTRPIIGKVTMRKFLRNYEAGFEQEAWIITNWAERGDVLLTEGLEKLYDRANDRRIDNHFMQALEFRDGKICKLRDHYDASKVHAPKPADAAAKPAETAA